MLNIVFEYVPKPLLRQNFAKILAKLGAVITALEVDAPIMRATIGALETLLIAQDLTAWNNHHLSVTPQRGLLGLLELSLDARPKVRKSAQEAVHKVLANPPPGPSLEHLASKLCAEFALTKIVELIQAKQASKKRDNKEINALLIHNLALISAITSSNNWPNKEIEPLCDVLLEISKTPDQYLVSAAFSAFEGLFNSMTSEIDADKFMRVLSIIFDLKPPVNDSHLAASWIAVVAKALAAYSKLDALSCFGKLPEIVQLVAGFLSSEMSDIYVSASQCMIALVTECVPDQLLLLPASNNEVTAEVYEAVDDVISQLSDIFVELLSVKYTHCAKEVMEVLCAILQKLRFRANPDFIKPVAIVGEWRSNEQSFQLKTEADAVIASAISVLGPEVVLSSLPLNLIDPKPNKPGRAWLLPLLRDNIRNARLGFFKGTFIPLIRQFEEKVATLEPNSVHVKIFQTIVDQIWSLLPHFCDLPTDLVASVTDSFLQNLGSLLYANVALRSSICYALKMMVDSNLTYASGALADDILLQQQFPEVVAKANVEYLSTKANNILSVLFNVYSQTVPESRGFISETIDSYLQIIPAADLEATFNKVCGLLKNALDQEATTPTAKGDIALSLTMMDLVVAMAKYVPASCHNALFSIFSSTVSNSDNLMQKRTYRIISNLNETDAGKQSLLQFGAEIQNVLVQAPETVDSARVARLRAIFTMIELLPASDLVFIPAILPKIIFSINDANSKTREVAFETLILMAEKMIAGGVIENSKLPGMEAGTPNTEASLKEFMVMVVAGLAGESVTKKRTITALGLIIYKFKGQINNDTLVDICVMVEDFCLLAESRDIAKAAIGFVKNEVLSLPEEILRSRCKTVLEKLLKASNTHQRAFNSKIKHIIERLIRRFGMEFVERNMPEDDYKLLTNIRKTRERSKRQKEEGENEEKKEKKKFASAYEEALYDSDSDESEAEDAPKGKKGKANQFILESDEPLNLLDRQALAHISSSKPKKFSKREPAAKSKFDKNGKLVFREDGKTDDDPLLNKDSISAYIDAIKSGPVRGQKGKLKFKKSKGDDDFSDDEAPAKPRAKVMGKGGISKPRQQQSRKKF
ncbi:hypothetical protein BABINDRAFT_159246 [Babjeviella inositovora NRRL Y-12698]|uniref:Uncharacterized protein n=1 Tax=Babjeviella inositovora NRRL Y-12698 TaxID=984486 RepID=A0A1E3QYL8_9ASCO|nr:uncharacterized protein BABINDRAFT_159246 [Babjeviella inositovora NRRL Y-12698]ODQ82726.1 hypothetical protein BABINDRAFT_159246 [Babjeviella inositovora NRRL Y-12698]